MDTVTTKVQTLFDELQYGDFSHGQKREKFNSLICEFLSLAKEGDKIFDIGCGSGFYMDLYLRQGIKKEQIVAVDLGPSNIENLKAKGFNAFVGNVVDLHFEDNVSDLTICQGVFPIVSNSLKAFSELVRVTKPGGYILLNVYYKWHPYFYIAHRATFPARYIYWHWNKKIADLFFPIYKILFQPIALITLGELLDDKTLRALYMDHVFSPITNLHSRSDIKFYVKECNCKIVRFKFNRFFSMLAAIIKT